MTTYFFSFICSHHFVDLSDYFLFQPFTSVELLQVNSTSNIMYISSALILLFAGGNLVAGHGAIVKVVGDQGGAGTALGSE
jgi:hypothetical protein